MPIGGERIGSAYVRIFGDGSGLPGDIRDALESSEPTVESAGRRMSSKYREAFNEGFLDDDAKKKFSDSIVKMTNVSEGSFNASAQNINNNAFAAIRADLQKRFKNNSPIADQIFNNLIADYQKSGRLSTFSDALKNLNPLVERARADLDRIEQEYLDKRLREEAAFGRAQDDFAAEGIRRVAQRNKEITALEAAFGRAQDAFAAEGVRRVALRNQKILEEQEKFGRAQEEFANEGVRRSIARDEAELAARLKAYKDFAKDTTVEAERLREALARLGTDSQRASDSQSDIITRLRGLQEGLTALPEGNDRADLSVRINDLRKAAVAATPASDRFSRSLLSLGDAIGSGTGRGSRNNFVNAIGGITRGLFNLATLGPRIGVEVGSKMVNAFQGASDTASGFQSAIGVLGKSLLGGVVSVGAIGLALGGLVIVLGPVAALISGITAALIALGGTVVLGAIAGLVGALGAGSALVAGVGVAALAINGLTDDMKDRLEPAIDRLQGSFDRLGRSAARNAFPGFRDALDEIAPALQRLKPLTDEVADAVGDLARQYAEGFNSEGFSRFIEQIGPFLADQVRGLGDAFQGFAEGAGGFFIASKPLIDDFVGGLQEIANEFSDYANSKGGRDEIRSFLETAAASAKSLGGFIASATEALGELLFAGADSGNTIFDDLSNEFEKYADFLRDPANAGAISDFFGNGVDIARDLGNAVEFLVGLIGDLDTEQSRQQLQDLFDAIGDVGGAVRDAAPVIVALGDTLKVLTDGIQFTVDAWQALFEVIELVSSGDLVGVAEKLGDAAGSLRELGESLGLVEPKGLFKLGEAGTASADGMDAASDAAADLAGTLDDVTGAATGATQALIGQNLAEADLGSNLRALGLTQRDVINATLGRADAQKRVNEAIESGSDLDKRAGEAVLDFIGVQKEAVNAGQRTIRQNSLIRQSFASLKGVIDDDLRLTLESEGIIPTRKALAETVVKYDELNSRKNIKKLIEATGIDASVKGIRRVIDSLNDVDKQKPKPKVDIDDKPAKDKLNGLEKLMREYSRETAEAKADLDDKPFRAKLPGINQALSGLNRAKASPIVDLNASNFFSGTTSVRAAIDNIPRTVNVDIIANRIGNFDFGFGADGGTVGEGTLQNLFKGMSGGGTIQGARYPYGDKDLYRLAPGEEVISNRFGQADRARGLLKAINAGVPVEVGTSGRTVDASGWTIQSNVVDPSAVANEVLNELMARTF